MIIASSQHSLNAVIRAVTKGLSIWLVPPGWLHPIIMPPSVPLCALRVAATASVYFRRFYLTNCFCLTDPRLVFVGCVYLASKAEESVLPAKHLVAFVRRQRPGWSYEMKHLLDMEMVLMVLERGEGRVSEGGKEERVGESSGGQPIMVGLMMSRFCEDFCVMTHDLIPGF